MTWKTRLVLFFARLRVPPHASSMEYIHQLRKKSEKAARIGSKLFDKKVKGVETTDTLAAGVPIRIYNMLDRDAESSAYPVIVYYHGGGFVLYSIDSHDNICRKLCVMNRCLVVSVAYRLAPEYTFPSAHEDAFTAIQWVRKNITSYGGNPDCIIVAGDSAGGNLAACMAHRCQKEAIPLRAQILIYPWIDGRLAHPSIEQYSTGYMLEKRTMLWFQQLYTPRPEERCHPQVSPNFEANFAGLPPALILTAQFDPLVDDGRQYYHLLKQAGNNAVYIEYKGLIHGFLNIPGIDPLAKQAFYDIRTFLCQLGIGSGPS